MKHEILTKRRKGIVICAKTQEQVKRDKPNADGKECSDIPKCRVTTCSFDVLSVPILGHTIVLCLLRHRSKVEEPDKMVADDQDTGKNKTGRCERNERPR